MRNSLNIQNLKTMNDKILMLLIALILLFSCKKNHGPTTSKSGMATSYTTNSQSGFDQVSQTDSLYFDANQNLTKIRIIFYETRSGIIENDTSSFNFTINPATGLATSYTVMTHYSPGSEPETESHNLIYDNQNRLIMDTTITKQNDPVYQSSVHFTYAGNMAICSEYNLTVSLGYAPIAVDTITLNNGNISRQVHYEHAGSDSLVFDAANSMAINNYSGFANPLYSQRLSSSLGVFFRRQYLRLMPSYMDCLSKNLPSDGIVKWTTDANGRVISGLTADGITITFTY